jgi:hypothetical protein
MPDPSTEPTSGDRSTTASRRAVLKAASAGVALGAVGATSAGAAGTTDCWTETKCENIQCPDDETQCTQFERQCCFEGGYTQCGDWQSSGCCVC